MKFKVIDTKNGKKYSVEEIELSSRHSVKALDEDCEKSRECCQMDAKEEAADLGSFSDKEIKALKKLAKYAEDLVAVFEAEKDDKELEKIDKNEKEDKDKVDNKEEKPASNGKDSEDEFGEDEDLGLDEDDEVVDEDEEVVDINEDNEVVTDSCSEPSIKDSKKSFGSIESKKTNDSLDDADDEIAEAWKAYYEKAKNRD